MLSKSSSCVGRMGSDEYPGDLLSQVQVAAKTVESVDVRAANGRMRSCLEHFRYARGLPGVQLGVDYHGLFVVRAVLTARGVVSRASR
jgi:hypothetical protein